MIASAPRILCAAMLAFVGATGCGGTRVERATVVDTHVTPRERAPPVTGPSSLSIGQDSFQACAIRSEQLWCWGSYALRLPSQGRGLIRANRAPTRIALPQRLVQVSVGGNHVCVRTAGGDAWCWGSNQRGEAGAPGRCGEVLQSPARVELPEPITSIAASTFFTCARTVRGRVWCWGHLGNAWDLPRRRCTPQLATTRDGAPLEVALLSNGSAVTRGGALHVWAYVGDEDTRTPYPVGELGPGVRMVAGGRHGCAILADRQLRCWGLPFMMAETVATERRRAGRPRLRPEEEFRPRAIEGVPHATVVHCSNDLCCAQGLDRVVRCWGGRSDLVRDGTSDHNNVLPPTRMRFANVVALTLSSSFGCYTANDRGQPVYCWGFGAGGQLGFLLVPPLTPRSGWSDDPVRIALPPAQ